MIPFRLRIFLIVAALAAFALRSVAQRKPPEPSPEKAKVHVTSTPGDGDVYVDGKFYGNTPSDILLPTGEHMVKVCLHGKEWVRSVQITGGQINIHADLAEEKDTSTLVDSKTSKQAGSPWGASQPAVDALRSLAEKLKQCPEIWLKYPAYQWGKKSTEIEQERTTQPRNVIWDVTSNESSRSPYSGYLQYSVHPEIDVLPVESYGEWLKKRGLIWDMAQKIMSIDFKFEFDVGPSGLELVRVLSRSKAYPDWETSPSAGWPGCLGTESKKPQSGTEAQPR